MITRVEMKLNSAKKHSVRYDAATPKDEEWIRSIYIGKDALPKPYPEKVTVIIEA